ncbi:MAG: Lar family restriction alleviation protein [Atopobiaceae bacterium]|nr:Lar family restriction alleviation protein [Atopobiaceae bacterium]
MSEELWDIALWGWDAPEDCAPDEPFDEPLFGEPQPVMNANGLLPCPFCGSGASLWHLDYPNEGRVWGIFCDEDGEMHGHFIDNYPSEAAAIKAWNTREEPITLMSPITTVSEGELQTYVPLRTCHGDKVSPFDWGCSACGRPWYGYVVKYCPWCGAKVVEE